MLCLPLPNCACQPQTCYTTSLQTTDTLITLCSHVEGMENHS